MAPARLRRLVPRPALVAEIEAASRHPLTIVRGASGTGKTALLGEWASERATTLPAVWVTVDDLSSGRFSFWSTVVDTLVRAGIATPGSLLADLVPFASPTDELRQTLHRGLHELPEPVLLVVDDLHRLRDTAVIDDLLWLLERGSRLHLVVGTRTVSALEGAVSKARFSPTVIGGERLAFTVDDTIAAARSAGIELEDSVLTALHARAEGWPLGVRLLLVEVEGAPASSAATAADALVRQEGARLVSGLESSGRLDLLLRTSIAERITAPVVAALVDDVDDAGIFDWMEVEGLGARDEAGRFRHHPFVREVLEAELVRRYPAEVPELRRRLARWADANEDIPTAIRQAALVRDWDLLSAVTRRHFGPITRLYSAEMRDALDQIPAGALRRFPILLTTLALLLNAQPTTTSQRLRALATITSGLLRDRLAKDESSERMWLLICRMAVERVTGRHDQAARTADDILEYLPLWEHRPDDDLRGTLSIVQLQVATSLFYVGRHADATPLLRDVGATGAPWRAMHALSLDVLITAMRGDMVATLAALGPLRERQSPSGWRGTYSATGYHLAEALLHLEDFDVEGARREVAMLDVHRPTIEHWPLLLRLDGLIALTDGDAFGGAQRMTTALAERKIASTSTAMSALISATKADLLIAAGQTQRARQTLPAARLESRLPLARIALAENRPDRALELVDPLVWEGGHLPRSQAEALLVQAVALARTGGPAAGVEAATTALGVLREAALRRPLMMVPRSELLPILHLVDGVDAEELLAGVPDPFGSASVMPRLSARELDVLAELVTAPGAAEIAARLFVSTNTVKSQLRSIYRKLGVTSREEALRVAFERGLARGSD